MTDHNTPAVDVSTEAVMRLLDGVTPGPWGCMDYLTDDCARWCIVPPDAVGTIANVHPDPDGIDARFIAASRDLVPAMLSRAQAAEAEVARLREALAGALKEGMRIATCVPIEQVQEAFSAALRAIAEQEGE